MTEQKNTSLYMKGNKKQNRLIPFNTIEFKDKDVSKLFNKYGRLRYRFNGLKRQNAMMQKKIGQVQNKLQEYNKQIQQVMSMKSKIANDYFNGLINEDSFDYKLLLKADQEMVKIGQQKARLINVQKKFQKDIQENQLIMNGMQMTLKVLEEQVQEQTRIIKNELKQKIVQVRDEEDLKRMEQGEFRSIEDEQMEQELYDKIIENLDNQSGEVNSKDIYEYGAKVLGDSGQAFQIVAEIRRSRAGNNSLYPFKEYETEDFYCPEQDQCFFKCIDYILKRDYGKAAIQKYENAVGEYIKQQKIKPSLEMPQCKLNGFSKWLKECIGQEFQLYYVKCSGNVYKLNLGNLKDMGLKDYILYIAQNHWFLLKYKQGKKLTNIVMEINKHADKIKQQYEEQPFNSQQYASLDLEHQQIEIGKEWNSDMTQFSYYRNRNQKDVINEQMNRVFVFDLETVMKEYQGTNTQTPYCAGILQLALMKYEEEYLQRHKYREVIQQKIKEVYESDCKVKVLYDESISEDKESNVIKRMFDHALERSIDNIKGTAQEIKQWLNNINKDKKDKKKHVNYEICMLAHNGSRFDNHVIFDQYQRGNLGDYQLTGYEKKEGTTMLGLMFEKIQNCFGIEFRFKFKLIDSCRYLVSSLKQLCIDWKVPLMLSKICDGVDVSCTKLEDVVDKNYRKEVERYQIKDITSLAYIMKKFYLQFWSYNINIFENVSISQAANKILNQKQKEKGISMYTFKNKRTNQMLRADCIYGGRNHVGRKTFKRNDHKQMVEDLKKLGKPCLIEFMQELVEYKDKIYNRYYNDECRLTQDFEKYYSSAFKNDYKEIYEYFKKMNKEDLLFDLDATSLYPSAMVNDEFIWPDLRTARIIDDKEEIEKIRQQFNKGQGMDKIYNLKFDVEVPQQKGFLVIPYTVGKQKIYASGHFKYQKMLSVDIEESIRHNKAQILKIHELIVYDKNLKVNPFKQAIEELFQDRLKYKSKTIKVDGKEVPNPDYNDCMQIVIKLVLNSLYGKQVQKDQQSKYKICSQTKQMKSDKLKFAYRNNVQEVLDLADGQLLAKIENDDYKAKCDVLGCLILSYSKRLMNKFIEKAGGFEENIVYASDTDSIYVEMKHAKSIIESDLYGSGLGQIKNDYGSNGIVFAQFVMNKCKTGLLNNDGVLSVFRTFKGMQSKDLVQQHFDQLLNGESVYIDKVNPFAKKEGKVVEQTMKVKYQQTMLKYHSQDDEEYHSWHITEQGFDLMLQKNINKFRDMLNKKQNK